MLLNVHSEVIGVFLVVDIIKVSGYYIALLFFDFLILCFGTSVTGKI